MPAATRMSSHCAVWNKLSYYWVWKHSAVMKKLIITLLVCAVGSATTLSAQRPGLEEERAKETKKIEQAITRKAIEAKEFRIEEKAATEIKKLIQKEATVKLKKSEVVDVFERVKKEFMASKRINIVKVETRDMKMIRRVTLEYCEPRRIRVPDGGVTLALLGIGLLGLLGTQRLMRRT